MIEIISSNDCPFCDGQIKIMKEAFFDDEFTVVNAESKEFASYADAELAKEGVPCIVVRGEDGVVRFAHNGMMEAADLRQIEREVKRAYYFPE